MRSLATCLVLLFALSVTPAAHADGASVPKRSLNGLEHTGPWFLGGEVALSTGFFVAVTLATSHPDHCSWCAPPGFDVAVRDALLSNAPSAANAWSNVTLATDGAVALAGVIVPALALPEAKGIWALEDSAIVWSSVMTNLAVVQLMKTQLGRLRPATFYGDTRAAVPASEADVSFPSGHSGIAFSLAASASTLAFLRGYESAPYVTATTGALAIATALLRISADRHWATDVITGAGIGSAIGLGLPLLFHRRATPPAATGLSGDAAGRIVLSGVW